MDKATVLVLGGDGFCGWPTCLHLSAQGYDVHIVDNLSRRAIDDKLYIRSLTPVCSIDDRLEAWRETSGQQISFHKIDIATQPQELHECLRQVQPDVVVHFAEQRSAPYSMRSVTEKRYTVDNNVSGTHNLLSALVEICPDVHLVHLGTMGVYGYSGDGFSIPEGYLSVEVQDQDGVRHSRDILYPTNPGSVYHLTKSIDQLLFQFYAKNDRLRITDLHQGIVWGTQTKETRLDARLINRFDYDGEYGTVLNRFLVQAAIGHPLTVHGTGGQTRAFINIQDTVRCVALAIQNAPARGDDVKILNQVAQTLRLKELAELVAQVTGAEIAYIANPRAEAPENDLVVSNATFRALGLDPIMLETNLFAETLEISGRYQNRVDLSAIPARSAWNDERKQFVSAA